MIGAVMRYRVPPVPPEATTSPEAEAAYLLEDGFVDTPAGGLADKLRRRGRLRIKYGVDPTAPSVTWGWGVCLRRLRRFQELGHTAVLVIGDFTARIGDPSGRTATRRQLDADEVERYVQGCLASLRAILGPDNLEVRRNSEWLEPMDMADVLRLTSQFTVAQMLERDDFRQRYEATQPIAISELLYPMLQAYDSVAITADVELGGTDQFFNLLVGRDLQQAAGQEPQVALCAPLLVGTDGQRKMSQSYGNYIAVDHPPAEIFGKVMSIPDDAMEQYVALGTDLRTDEKERLTAELGGVRLKRRLAREMVAMFHGPEAAEAAEAEFDRVFVRHDAPSELEESVTSERYVPRILVDLGWATSLSDARRRIKGGGVKVDGQTLDDEHANLDPGTYVLQSGRRRFRRVTVK
jgi:tyrosyl-tRNA synthetase